MDKSRRTFLKLILIGGGTFLAGKVFGPLFLRLLVPKTNFKDFQIIEDNKKLSIYDASGEEIFQIDKGA